MNRPYKPSNTPGLIPYLIVQDIQESIAFYRRAFMFSLECEPMTMNNHVIHAEMRLFEAKIMLAPEGAWGTVKKAPVTLQIQAPVGLYVYVENVENFFRHAQSEGAEALNPPETMFWGDRMCRFKDLNGYDWSFATNVLEYNVMQSPKIIAQKEGSL